MTKSENIGKLADALAKAQGKINHAAKEASNPGYKRGGKDSRYADLASIWDACREALSANGLAIVQTVSAEGNVVKVTTVLAHSSGEWISGEMSAVAPGSDAQKIGSATTYLRRYSLASMVGVAPESDDDDGNQASGVSAQAGRKPSPVRRWTPPADAAPSPPPMAATDNPGEDPDPVPLATPLDPLASSDPTDALHDVKLALRAAKSKADLKAIPAAIGRIEDKGLRAEARSLYSARLGELS